MQREPLLEHKPVDLTIVWLVYAVNTAIPAIFFFSSVIGFIFADWNFWDMLAIMYVGAALPVMIGIRHRKNWARLAAIGLGFVSLVFWIIPGSIAAGFFVEWTRTAAVPKSPPLWLELTGSAISLLFGLVINLVASRRLMSKEAKEAFQSRTQS